MWLSVRSSEVLVVILFILMPWLDWALKANDLSIYLKERILREAQNEEDRQKAQEEEERRKRQEEERLEEQRRLREERERAREGEELMLFLSSRCRPCLSFSPPVNQGWDSSAFTQISVEQKLKSVFDDDHFRERKKKSEAIRGRIWLVRILSYSQVIPGCVHALHCYGFQK